jgi:hypothetical protein
MGKKYRDRFVLPVDKNISYYTDVINNMEFLTFKFKKVKFLWRKKKYI